MNSAHKYKRAHKNISAFINISVLISYSEREKGVIPLKKGKREGNVVMALLLKSIKDPTRLQWHEVYPERRLSAAECAKKRYHHCLEINFLNNRCK